MTRSIIALLAAANRHPAVLLFALGFLAVLFEGLTR